MQHVLRTHVQMSYVEFGETEMFSWFTPVQHLHHICNKQLALWPNSYSSLEVKPVIVRGQGGGGREKPGTLNSE